MASASKKLLESLKALQKLQKSGKRVVRSAELSRGDRELLEGAGYLRKVIPGWLLSTSPGTRPGDTAPWYASFWEFCRRYCNARFGKAWYVSPEQSLLVHAGDMTIPHQLIIHAKKGSNNLLQLPFETKLLDVKTASPLKAKDVEVVDGLRVVKMPVALARVSANFFQAYPLAAQALLQTIKDASVVLPSLLDEGRSAAAGRLAGVFELMGRPEIAGEILDAMKAAGYSAKPQDSLLGTDVVQPGAAYDNPVAGRIHGYWEAFRSAVLEEALAGVQGLPEAEEYLAAVDEAYVQDAYHSLSIEGYVVSDELIRRVASGEYDPDENAGDLKETNALASRGYYECFQKVKASIRSILEDGEGAGAVVRADHKAWYRELYAPQVKAGLLSPVVLSGYRDGPVYIKGSRHVPANAASVPDAMGAFFDCLEKEASPIVRAVLGHWLFGYIHPYQDGNGRMARFLMNAMLASGGYPWTIIRIEDRSEYMEALETASVGGDIKPFARFVVGCVSKAIEERAGGEGADS